MSSIGYAGNTIQPNLTNNSFNRLVRELMIEEPDKNISSLSQTDKVLTKVKTGVVTHSITFAENSENTRLLPPESLYASLSFDFTKDNIKADKTFVHKKNIDSDKSLLPPSALNNESGKIKIKPASTLKNAEGLNIPSVSANVNGVNIFISPKGLQQIMSCETYVPAPGINIKDGAGITIGYGHTGGGVKIRNKQDAVNVLAHDVKVAIQDKFRVIPKEILLQLNQDQLNALASAAINLSAKGFRNFGPVKELLDKNQSVEQKISNASFEFMSKLRKGFAGLTWRRATEALTFSGIYVSNPGKNAVHMAKEKGLLA